MALIQFIQKLKKCGARSRRRAEGSGAEYQLLRKVEGKPVQFSVLGMPGSGGWSAIPQVRKAQETFFEQKIPYFLQRIVEIEGYKNGQVLARDQWQASNLFVPLGQMEVQKTWKTTFIPTEIPTGPCLCIALDGVHGTEGA